jgi:hypothetical protein
MTQKQMDELKRVRPFWCGTQYVDWKERNCWRCKKSTDDNEFLNTQKWKCEMEEALSAACMDDGTISREIAKRIGYPGNYYSWDCPQREKK